MPALWKMMLLSWCRPRAAVRLALSCLLLAAISGCQMDLHTKVAEADANEMLGALLAEGIDARKHTPDGGKTWSISVEESQTVRAIEVLRDNALPRERRVALGDLFKKEGLISSPVEERVRFLFGVQQGLAETLSKIDGVIVARVHIVLPNNDPLATVVKPSSAAVFVKHRRGVEMQVLVPAIKNLVVHAVEGLEYNQVSVTTVAADPPHRPEKPAGLMDSWSSGWLWGLAFVLVLLVVVGGAVLAVRRGWWRPRLRALAKITPQSGELVPADGQAV